MQAVTAKSLRGTNAIPVFTSDDSVGKGRHFCVIEQSIYDCTLVQLDTSHSHKKCFVLSSLELYWHTAAHDPALSIWKIIEFYMKCFYRSSKKPQPFIEFWWCFYLHFYQNTSCFEGSLPPFTRPFLYSVLVVQLHSVVLHIKQGWHNRVFLCNCFLIYISSNSDSFKFEWN